MNESEVGKPVRKNEDRKHEEKETGRTEVPFFVFCFSFSPTCIKLGTRKQLVLALSVEEHAESSKERPRKDENASRKYEDEKKREMEMRRGLCVGRVELWERKREKGTASL